MTGNSQSETVFLNPITHLMGTNGQLFPLTDNTDGAAVDQVQQQHLLISRCQTSKSTNQS